MRVGVFGGEERIKHANGGFDRAVLQGAFCDPVDVTKLVLAGCIPVLAKSWIHVVCKDNRSSSLLSVVYVRFRFFKRSSFQGLFVTRAY